MNVFGTRQLNFWHIFTPLTANYKTSAFQHQFPPDLTALDILPLSSRAGFLLTNNNQKLMPKTRRQRVVI